MKEIDSSQPAPVFKEPERRTLLGEWNQTAVDFPLEQIYPQLFAAQVSRTPQAPAVQFQKTTWSYDELDRRANHLADALLALGVGPERLVALPMERSLEFALGVLGVLKAGGAFLPLDPAQPAARLAQMLADASPAVVLTQKKYAGLIPAKTAQVLCLDAPEWTEPHLALEVAPPCAATPESLAYMIYTSGSTGQPKGVQVTHRSLLNHNLAMGQAFGLRSSDRMLQFSALTFDPSIQELFPTWLAGGCVVLRSEECLSSLQRFLDFVHEEQISILQLPVAFWHELVEQLKVQGLPPSVRLVVMGGEKAAPEKYQAWKQHVSGKVLLVHQYGPTETTITATQFVAGSADCADLPIGRPIANVQVYVLDELMQPVPSGAPGELYIGGAGVARGYCNRPELTAERFIPNPFSAQSGARLYKTGDLARWRSDGNLEFLGRIDQQVKVRGFRIEPGEIESVLRQHHQVREAVVVVVELQLGQKRLLGYYVRHPAAQALAPEQLRQFLAGRLPDYMVPASLMELKALPLTPHGKVDRKALPLPTPSQAAGQPQFVAPESLVEKTLAGIWAEVLRVPQIGIHDNFFTLGGDSLLSLQAVSKANQAGLGLTAKQVFQYPTIAQLAAAVQTQTVADTQAGLVLKRGNRDGKRPLSFAQQRLWFLHQAEPQSATFNLSSAWLLSGALQVRALGLSLHALVLRHEIFQTAFGEQEHQPVQVVVPQESFTVALVNLESLSEAEREAQALRQMQQESRRPFDLTLAPLLRALVLRLSPERHYLLLVMHHIICDGSSLPVLYKELQAFYRQFTMGEMAGVAELPVQYADYALWEHQHLLGPKIELQLEYWKKQLGGRLPVLELPADRPRPTRFSSTGARYSFSLPVSVTAALRQFKQVAGVTSFHVLLAAFQALLYRYTGQEDLLVGVPFTNRPLSELWGLMGFFVSTQVLRTAISGQQSFRQLLGQVQAESVEAMARLDVPFDKLVEELNPARDPSYTPVFQVVFAYQSVPALELAGLQLRPVEVHNGTAMFDLTLDCQETAEGLQGAIEYRTDLFEETSIARMAGHFQKLLESAIASPDLPLEQLPLLSKEEHHRVLVEWNQTEVPFPQELTIPQAIQAQVQRTPEAVAVVFEDQQLTYGELNSRANALAACLVQLGVGPESLVGLCVERSPGLVIGALAILKAGGAYLPLDPAYPRERLAFMCQDAQISVLLTQEKLAGLFALPESQIVCLDQVQAPALAPNPQPALTPDNLAYVIYTSGSTGKPKGVMVTQRNVVNFFTGMDAVLGTEPGVWLAATSISFDISVLELFWTLARGFRVILHSVQSSLRTPPAQDYSIPGLIRRHQVTHFQCTPSHASLLLQEPGFANAFQRLKKLLLGGEALPLALVQQLATDGEIINMYGPTETTVWSTAWVVDRALGRISIGRAIANTQIYILDPHLSPVPIGVPGEIFIGGVGVTRGYLKQPELTAQRFVADPFSRRTGARLYRTGDLARWLPDGTIECLGRADHQIKLRGFRIELGEIESVLLQHPQVGEAVVSAIGDASRDKQLVAYYVAKAPAPSVGELRQFLKDKLPAYLVPAQFVVLEKLPLTPNGKVDRKALPPPPPEQAQTAELVLPRTPTESQLAQIWCEVLGLKQVGVHDNYFDLGGHSLKAVWLFQKVKKVFGKELPMVTLFQAPTIAQLAEVVEQDAQSGTWASLVPIKATGTKPPFFCIHGVGGNILEFLDLAKYMDEDQPFYGLQAVGLDGKRPWLETVQEMAAHYIKEIRAFQPEGPYYLGGSSFGGLVAYEIAQQLHAQGQSVALLVFFDTYAPGHPKLIGQTSRLKKRLNYWQYRINLHWSNLKMSPRGQRWRYVRTKAVKWVRGKGTQLKELRLFWHRRFAEQLVTKEIRQTRRAGRRAAEAYVAAPYPGQATLFRAIEKPKGIQPDPLLGWGDLVLGGIEVYDTPGHHGAIMRDPRARTLAEQLKDSLRKAHLRDPRCLQARVQLEELAQAGAMDGALLGAVEPTFEIFDSRQANLQENALSSTICEGDTSQAQRNLLA